MINGQLSPLTATIVGFFLKKLGIQQSTLASGIVGVLTFGIGLLLQHYNVNIGNDTISAILIVIIPLITHAVPDVALVDQSIKNMGTAVGGAVTIDPTYDASKNAKAVPVEVSVTPENININKV